MWARVGALSRSLSAFLKPSTTIIGSHGYSTCLTTGLLKKTSILSAVADNKANFLGPWKHSEALMLPGGLTFMPSCGYKVRRLLKKRCPDCYFVRRQGRLFIECKVKPRHKQMQQLSKRKLFRED